MDPNKEYTIKLKGEAARVVFASLQAHMQVVQQQLQTLANDISGQLNAQDATDGPPERNGTPSVEAPIELAVER